MLAKAGLRGPSEARLLSRLRLSLSSKLMCRCSIKQLPSCPRSFPCQSRDWHGRHGRPRSCRCCRRVRSLPQPAAPRSGSHRTDCSLQPRCRSWVRGPCRKGQWVRAAAPRRPPPGRAQAPARRRRCRRQQRRAKLLWAPPARPACPRAPACAPAPAGTATAVTGVGRSAMAPHPGQHWAPGAPAAYLLAAVTAGQSLQYPQCPSVQSGGRAAQSCCALDPEGRRPRWALAQHAFLA